MDDNPGFPVIQKKFRECFFLAMIISTDREIFEEQIAPVVLDIEEEAKDEHHVHEADEDDHHHTRVNRHPYPPLRPHLPL